MVKENIEIRREYWNCIRTYGGKDFLERIIEITDMIKPDLNKFTHRGIIKSLQAINLSVGYEKYIYLYLKHKKEVKESGKIIRKDNSEIYFNME